MSIDIVLKLESDQAMHEYLMNHSYLYKELNRDPDYFEIFLTRMNLCKLAAKKLQASFKLIINGLELI